MPVGVFFFREAARWLLSRVRQFYSKRLGRGVREIRYGGHYSVTRSMIEGLEQLGLPHCYNPKFLSSLTSRVVVLAGATAVKQAIQYKRAGKIEYLAVGPNVVTFACERDYLLSDPAIDLVVVPSEWVAEMYLEDDPGLASKLFVWPAGVDERYWSPLESASRDKVILYDKLFRADRRVLEDVKQHLLDEGFDVLEVRYGAYDLQSFRTLLRQCAFMVAFTDSESQGIAWAEAWSCEVPTFVYRRFEAWFAGRRYMCSSAPYLSPQCGAFFGDVTEFKQIVFDLGSGRMSGLAPRQWLLANMTDAVCAQRLFDRVMKC